MRESYQSFEGPPTGPILGQGFKLTAAAKWPTRGAAPSDAVKTAGKSFWLSKKSWVNTLFLSSCQQNLFHMSLNLLMLAMSLAGPVVKARGLSC